MFCGLVFIGYFFNPRFIYSKVTISRAWGAGETKEKTIPGQLRVLKEQVIIIWTDILDNVKMPPKNVPSSLIPSISPFLPSQEEVNV